tara:strand:+ start:1379 stop:1909 length:531 start_codon:yes stop_codon:yes gene_type:complete
MAARPVLRMGHPLLRQQSRVLSREEILSAQTAALLADLKDTMDAEGGIGIAAPQIGENLQVTIIELPENSERYGTLNSSARFTIFNPIIEVIDETNQGFWEGCLSVPGLRGYVERPRKVRITYLDEKAEKQIIEPEGFLATVFQHELDHLFGVLYIDRIKDPTMLSFNEEFDEFHT